MIRSIRLDTTPTARQAQAILSYLEEELRLLGARVQHTPYGAVHFRLPPPWRARHLGVLHLVSSGRATIGAAAGNAWRVRYELKFTALQWLAIALSALVVFAGVQTGRLMVLYGLAFVWITVYAVPYVAATMRFRRLVEQRVRSVEERGERGDRGGSVQPD